MEKNYNSGDVSFSLVFSRRRYLLLGVLIAFLAVGLIACWVMPNIYQGQAILINSINESISVDELRVSLLQLDREKKKLVFTSTWLSIKDVQLRGVMGSKDKFMIIIDSVNRDTLLKSFDEMLRFVSNIPYAKGVAEAKLMAIKNELENVEGSIKNSKDLMPDISRKIASKDKDVYFNPLEVINTVSQFQTKKLQLTQEYERFRPFQFVIRPYIKSDPVSPRIVLIMFLAGLAGIVAGVLISFAVELGSRRAA